MITPTRPVISSSSTNRAKEFGGAKPSDRQTISLEEIGDRLEREGPFDVQWRPMTAASGRSGWIEIRYRPSLPVPAVDVRLWRDDIDRIRERQGAIDTPHMKPGDLLRVPVHLDLSIGRRLSYSVIYNFEGESRSAREQEGWVDTM
jgi:hypothetical protein